MSRATIDRRRFLGSAAFFAGRFFRRLVLGVAFVLAAQPAPAQVLYGALMGDVADASRAVLPGATVTVTNRDTGLQRETTTDGSGAYSFRDLQPGIYELKVALPGFKSYARAGLAVTLNAIARADVQMEVGGQTETVTVSGEKPLLQTERADVSTQLDAAQVTNLPISGNGRNFQQLYKLIPGASTPVELHSDAGNPQRSLGTNFNGVSRSNNNTRLDGATVSYPWLPHIMAYVPPAEAVETVNVVTNSFDAEQGMAGGAAVSVAIKSGTNAFHGTGHWFHTNSALRARNYFFVGTEVPKNDQNQFGSTFGGPIKHNKLFFFANWERTQRRQTASANRTVPTEALRRGDFTGTGTRDPRSRHRQRQRDGTPAVPRQRHPRRPHRPGRAEDGAVDPGRQRRDLSQQLLRHRHLHVRSRQHRFQGELQPRTRAVRSLRATRFRRATCSIRPRWGRRAEMRWRAGSRAARPAASRAPPSARPTRSPAMCCWMPILVSRASGLAPRMSTSARTTGSSCWASPAPTARTACRADIRGSSSQGSRRSAIPTCRIPSRSATTSMWRSAI